jgi:quaternary ammonium compound-resistance protein SugE
MNPWIILIIAGLLEVCWATSLKATAGFTRLWPTAFFLSTLSASMLLLSLAVKSLPVGTAYAVWVGIGAAGTAIASLILYGETMTVTRAMFLGLLIASIVGLKLSTPAA